MTRWEQVAWRVVTGRSDAGIRFDELRHFLLRLGFEERVRGSHHLYRRAGVVEKINLQRDGTHAKPYQVRQVRNVLLKYRLWPEEPCTDTKS